MESTPPSAPHEPPPDQELLALPAPRRPWRRATLFTLGLCAILSLWLAAGVLPDARYSLATDGALDIGDLAHARLGPELENRWVRAGGELSTRAVRYRRPLEHGSYRLASVVGEENVWVQIRVPEGEEDRRFVPPDSFVGRLMPVSALGLRQKGMAEAVDRAGLPPLEKGSWLLVDGESPAAVRWVLGLVALLGAVATFSIVGLVRLSRSIPSGAGGVPGRGP
jgi:hypothetical protein